MIIWSDKKGMVFQIVYDGPPVKSEKNKNRQFSEWVLSALALVILFSSALITELEN